MLYDNKYNFNYFFDKDTGFYFRSGILDKDGNDTGKDPFMASFPHLIDVGIMGHCIHGKTGLCKASGVECYQSGYSITQPNMSPEDFESIAKQCSGKTNQIALGGRGDPNQHEFFKEILHTCKKCDIVPNYTTSGLGLTDEQVLLSKRYCGAVAVSWYRSDHTLSAIRKLVDAGCKTNIHYVLSENSIEEAVERLSSRGFSEGIGAVIFLLHKPVGQGSSENVLKPNNPYFTEFCRLVNFGKFPYKIGFDSCSVPMIINHCPQINKIFLDTCEGARFSCYISSNMVMSPCSFDREEKYGVSLKNQTIEDVWNSPEFENFRSHLRFSCKNCQKRDHCMGGCPLTPEIVLCNKGERVIM